MSNLTAAASIEDVCERIDRDGYAIVERLLSPAEAAEKRASLVEVLNATPTGRNAFEGLKTQRIYALLAKTRAFDGPAAHPLVLGVLEQVLGRGCTLSAPQGIQIGPGEAQQSLHRDDGVYPIPRPHPELVLNTMWALDDFTAENGATYVVPGSHKWNDRSPDHSMETVQAVMPAGSVMFFLGSVIHGGGANTTDRPRLGVILEYVAGWLRQQENQYLAVPRELAQTLPEPVQRLLGYDVHGSFLGNVDGRHPLKVLAEA